MASQRRRCRKTEPHISHCAESGKIGHPNNGRSLCSAFPRKLNSATVIQRTRTRLKVQTLTADGCRSRGRRGVPAAGICCHSLYSLLIVPTTEGCLKKSCSSAKNTMTTFPRQELAKTFYHHQCLCVTPLRADVGKTQSRFK